MYVGNAVMLNLHPNSIQRINTTCTVQYSTVQDMFIKSENHQYKNCSIYPAQFSTVQNSTVQGMFIKSETPNTRIAVCSISSIFQYSEAQYSTVQGMFIKSETLKYKNWCMQYIPHNSVQCSTTLYRVCLLKVKTPNTRIVVCSINNIFQFNILMFKLIVNI